MGKYPTQNQRFYDTRSKDINTVPSYYSLPPKAQASFEEQHPKHWYESQQSYIKRLDDILASSSRHIIKDNPVYNPNPTAGFYTQASASRSRRQKTFTSLDIETDDYGHPLSVIAHKFIRAKDGSFQAVDTYQRYYQTHGWDVRATQAVHGFTPAALKSLRKQQGADYGKTYKGQEITDLQNFLGHSVIVGHNIGEFDLNKLFPEGNVPNSTIDTLSAARNAWKGAKNSLDHVYYRIFGRTMEEDGLFHHDANADVIASMRIFEAMSKNEGTVGQALRYIISSRGRRHMVEYDEYMKSMIARGNYKSSKGKRRVNLHEVYMSPEETGLVEYDEDGNKRWVGGYHEDKPLSIEELADEQLKRDAAAEAVAWANSVKQRQASKSLHKKSESATYLSNNVAEQELYEALNQFNNYKRLGLVEKIASLKSAESITALRNAAGYGTEGSAWNSFVGMANAVKSAKERERILDQYKRIDKFVDRGIITEKQANNLKDLTGSYDDLVDATEKVIEANQRLRDTYSAIASIKPYDINHLIDTAHTQFSGVTTAARGVVPNFILNPMSRLGSAALNSVDRSVSPWNAVQRVWNSGVGGAVTGGLTAAMGPGGFGLGMAINGGVNALTQIGGNYKQSKLEMFGLSLQNNLNTLGAMISWVSAPFQMLHKATKLLIGSFSGLTFSVKNLMTGGINSMSQLGNPLTELTGVNYSSYAGTTMMDVASLFNKGSMNSIYEDFANQQRAFYTTGQVNTNRLVASSLLGVYDSVYGPTTDVKGSYNTMANRLLTTLQSQSPDQQARTMYLASQIDKNLPSLLRTANLLGVSDINTLTNPQNRGMYWRPLNDNDAGTMRWTQYEYGAASEQLGYSKMRLANTLWQAVGKDLYNGINGVIDALAGGQWDTALDNAAAMWESFRVKLSTAWNKIKAHFEEDENGEGGWSKTFTAIGLQITNIALGVAKTIISVWDAVIVQLTSKAQGLISYLSTVRIEPTFENGKLGFKMSNIGSITANDSDKIYNERVGNLGQMGIGAPKEGMGSVARLAEILGLEARGGSATNPGYNPTVGDIKAKIASLRAAGANTLGLSELGIEQIGTDEASVDALINWLLRKDSKDYGPWAEAGATWLMPSGYNTRLDRQAIYDKTGIGKGIAQLAYGTEDIATQAINAVIDRNNKVIIDLRLTESTGKTLAKSLIGDGKTNISKNFISLQNLFADGFDLVVQGVSNN